MSSLLIGLLGAVVATNPVVGVSNPVQQTNGLAARAPGPDDPVQREFKKLEEADDDAMAEVDGWIKENQEFAARGGGIPRGEMNQRIRKRLAPVGEGYAAFIKLHPDHVKARLAYASFLDDIGDEEGEVAQLEKARELDPNDPAVWNNLANYYGHTGELTNAFAYYEKAIALDAQEPVYYHNFGTTVYLFRKDAREYFNLNEQQVFDKALDLYSHALRLDPTNFPLASDVSQTYYGIKPLRTNDALRSWTNTLSIAHDEIEREGVFIHLARLKMSIGRFDEARAHLNAVTNSVYDDLKTRLARNLSEREKGSNQPGTATNQVPVAPVE